MIEKLKKKPVKTISITNFVIINVLFRIVLLVFHFPVLLAHFYFSKNPMLCGSWQLIAFGPTR